MRSSHLTDTLGVRFDKEIRDIASIFRNRLNLRNLLEGWCGDSPYFITGKARTPLLRGKGRLSYTR